MAPGIFLSSLGYALVHLGKPALEIPYSFLVGLVFAHVALKTESIFPTFLAHSPSAVIFDV